MYFQLEKKSDDIYAKNNKNLSAVPHLHSQIELVLIKSSSTVGYANDKSVLLQTGDLFISFPNQIHYYIDQTRPVYHDIIIVSPESCTEFSHIFKNYTPKIPMLKNAAGNPIIMNAIDNIIHFAANTDKFSNAEVRGNILVLMSELLRSIELDENISCETDSVKNIINYCYENYSSDISLQSVAEALHMNKYHVSHLFSGRLNIGFCEYINRLRILHACEILKSGDQPMSEVAFAVGYNSIRTFNRAFTSIKKVTPREYRNNHKSKS